MPRRLSILLVLAIFMCCSPLAGCSPLLTSTPGQTPAATAGPVVSAPSDPAQPIMVKLILSTAPKLNEVVDLELDVQSIADAAATTVSYDFPASVVFESGSLDWKGDLKQKEPLVLKAQIKITQEGQVTLKGSARSPQSNGDVWADAAYIYLTVTKDAGMVGFPSIKNPNQGQQPLPTPPATNPTP